eukprot:CAMPEP_0201579448 /NCGR_PEP_ID=MMETSP0190_2-20130828/27005_1 /ASSEMBLY_ACC=CAM_ASM_000263 /TAXON_ID=37353 /ORGANISM="Rosalina sp." /LENGTH=71 /DNA_ID=CAMNT_0048013873 /DNA_START=733 /DNA_END=948 /DNA_ORIENTATION=+
MEDEDDDPIMYTAPITEDNQNNISSMTHLIRDKRYKIGTPTPDLDVDDDDISGTEEVGDDPYSSDNNGDGL